MFFIGMEDNITGFELCPKRHYIHPVTGIQGKNDFLMRICVNKIFYNMPRSFHSPVGITVDAIGYFLGKPVPASAFTASWKIIVILVKRFYHPTWHKRVAGVIEIDGRVPVLKVF